MIYNIFVPYDVFGSMRLIVSLVVLCLKTYRHTKELRAKPIPMSNPINGPSYVCVCYCCMVLHNFSYASPQAQRRYPLHVRQVTVSYMWENHGGGTGTWRRWMRAVDSHVTRATVGSDQGWWQWPLEHLLLVVLGRFRILFL